MSACPTCGSTRLPGWRYVANLSRTDRRRLVRHGHWRLGRRDHNWTHRGVPVRRTYLRCVDPFHDQPLAPPAPPRGRLGHHPDIAKLKRATSRALQGKDRR
jgi:hypothetical protein